MKKGITISLLALVIFACSRKTVSTSETTAATTQAPAPDGAHATLLDQGKGIFATKCSKCHATKDVTAYTTTQWQNILKSMIPKARLNETEANQVTTYVMEFAKK
jgi:cytochrome c5